MSEQDNTSIVKDAYDAFKRGDIPSLLTMVTDDIEWITPGPPDVMPAAGSRRGRDAVAEFFSTLNEQEDIEVFDHQDYIAQGDKVVAIINYRGRVKATGRSAEAVLVHIFDLKDGKIKRFREFFDTAAILPAFISAQAATPS